MENLKAADGRPVDKDKTATEEILESLLLLNKEFYPKIRDFVNEAGKESVVQSGVEVKERLVDLLSKFADEKALNIDSHYSVEKDKEVRSYTEHDLSGLAINVLSVCNLLRNREWMENNEPKKIFDFLKIMADNWPQYSFIMEDLLLRKLEKKGRPVKCFDYPLDLEMVKQALGNLKNSEAVLGRVKLLLAELPDFESILKGDEEVKTQPGVVMNLLFNIIRNACKEKLGATIVRLTAERENDELVLRVLDNGRGMSRGQLEADSEKFIFNVGAKSSATGGTGLGLADAPERLSKLAGGKLKVRSSLRNAEELKWSAFPKDDEWPPLDLQSIKKEEKDYLTSTIFEIRLSITKKIKS